jgi:hypothetical protein
MWHESRTQAAGIIRRDTIFPNQPKELILSGERTGLDHRSGRVDKR